MFHNVATICSSGKHKFATRSSYAVRMQGKDSVRDVLARNLDRLMRARTPRWTQKDLAKAAGVSQRTVGNMLRGSDVASGATLDRVDAVAKVFGYRSWHLIMPDLPQDPDDVHTMSDVLTGYILADDEGRELIHSVAARVGKYRAPSPVE